MLKNVLILLLCLLFQGRIEGQETEVASCLQKIQAALTDSVRLKYGDEIPAYLEKIEYGKYALETPVQFLGYKKCVNAEAELFSWAIPLKRGQVFYNWFRFKDPAKVYLIKSFSVAPEEQSAWLYYDLVGFESQGQSYFVLLGWSKTRRTNLKVVQIVRFEKDGTITYNHPLMRRGNSRSASLTFEYTGEGSMMLKQDRKGKRIIFDHLAPSEEKYKGYFMFYGPDASYDALVLKKGEWWYEENVRE